MMNTVEDAIWQIWIWQHNNTGSFFSTIILAYCKADSGNRAKLGKVFPGLPIAMQMWHAALDNGEALFRQFNIPESRRGK